jgi:hypothetical protein
MWPEDLLDEELFDLASWDLPGQRHYQRPPATLGPRALGKSVGLDCRESRYGPSKRMSLLTRTVKV